MSRTVATDGHSTFYQSKSLQWILSAQRPSTLERWRALNAAAQLAPAPPQFFPPSTWCSQARFYPRRSWTWSTTDCQEVWYCNPRPKLTIPTSCIPRKEVSFRHREGERLSLPHHTLQHAAGSTQPILGTFRACFVINFCKWIIESLSWIRSIW